MFFDSYIKYINKTCGQKPGPFNAYKSGSYSNHLVFMVTVKYLFMLGLTLKRPSAAVALPATPNGCNISPRAEAFIIS
jgi:hypothetical protein